MNAKNAKKSVSNKKIHWLFGLQEKVTRIKKRSNF